jgi:hypothetical protein
MDCPPWMGSATSPNVSGRLLANDQNDHDTALQDRPYGQYEITHLADVWREGLLYNGCRPGRRCLDARKFPLDKKGDLGYNLI